MTKKEMLDAVNEFKAALNKFLIVGVEEIQRQLDKKVEAGDFDDEEWNEKSMGWFNDQRDTKLGFVYTLEREIKKFCAEVAKCELYEAGEDGERELD